MSEKRIDLKRQTPKCSRGMTFTEVLVATAILAFAMIPILTAMTNTHSYSIRIERKSKSLLFAQNQIEELRAQAIQDYDASWSISDQSLGSGYYYSITANTDPALRTVTVSAGFDEDQDLHLDAVEVLVSLRTLIAKQQ